MPSHSLYPRKVKITQGGQMIKRTIKIDFWKDAWVKTLTQEEKFFYLYLLTNEHTTVSGAYSINLDQISEETGSSLLRVNEMLGRFDTVYHKLHFDFKTTEIYLFNWQRHNPAVSPKLKVSIQKDLAGIQSESIRSLLQVPKLYPVIKAEILEKKERKSSKKKGKKRNIMNIYNRVDSEIIPSLDENKEAKKRKIPYQDIIQYLNQKVGGQYKSRSKQNQKWIRMRWNEGFRFKDFVAVIDCKLEDWHGQTQQKYLRPETLFGNKFEGYLNQSLLPLDTLPKERNGKTIFPVMPIGTFTNTEVIEGKL